MSRSFTTAILATTVAAAICMPEATPVHLRSRKTFWTFRTHPPH
jgi:hypothetical protein